MKRIEYAFLFLFTLIPFLFLMYIINSLNLEFAFLQNSIAQLISVFLKFLNYNSNAEGKNVIVTYENVFMQFKISFDSIGWKGLLLIFALIISTPQIKFERKIKVLVIFLPLIFLINILRILSTILIGINFDLETFKIWHSFLWSYIFILSIFAIWFIWLFFEYYKKGENIKLKSDIIIKHGKRGRRKI